MDEQRNRRGLGIPDSRSGSYLNLESELIALRRALTTASGNLLVRVPLQSENYVPNAQGWRFNLNGDVELNNAVIRGTLAAADGVFTGNISATQITADFLSVNRIENKSLVGGKLADNTVTASQIANSTITATQIANATITGSKIASGTIAGSNIANATIAGANIVNATIASAKIENNAIIAEKIANAAVTSAKIQNGAITAEKIASLAITANEIANLTIDASKIMNLQINSDKIGTAAVLTDKINNLAVNNSKVASDINGAKITAGTISGVGGSFNNLACFDFSNSSIGSFVIGSPATFNSGVILSSTIRGPNVGTVASGDSEALRWRTIDGGFRRLSSSLRYKQNIQDAPFNEDILQLRPVYFNSAIEDESQTTLHYGIIAEEAASLDLPSLVINHKGVPDSVNYELIGLYLLPWVRQLMSRVEALENYNG